VKIRLHGTEDECREMTGRLARVAGIVSVSQPYADRGASLLVRVYVEARLNGPGPARARTELPGGTP
jgi:hypothetical protein